MLGESSGVMIPFASPYDCSWVLRLDKVLHIESAGVKKRSSGAELVKYII